jgi:hypothetical protein
MKAVASHEILGRTVTMPVEVRDASAGTVIFDIDLAPAAAAAPPGFTVIESAPGRAQVAIAVVDYRDNDLGSYREVGTILFVRPASGGPDGTFITHLPVDREFTCVAGNEIWGYPKSIEQINVDQSSGSSRWALTMHGELVLDLTLPRGGDDEMPLVPMTSYTVRGGVPHATEFSQGGSGSSIRFDGDGVELRLGQHPIAKELAALGLPTTPVLSTWTEHMRATFGEPRPL